MTIIITGGNGFVGRWLVHELRRAEPDTHLIVWDIQRDDTVPVEQVAIDITDPASYQASLQSAQPNWLIHLAALSSVHSSWGNSSEFKRVNVDATTTLLRTVTTVSPATQVLAISSADIYGTTFKNYGSTPLPELPLDQAFPLNPYAESKWAMEKAIEERFNDRVIRVRSFPHTGPGQARGFVTADFASQIAAIEAGKQPPIVKVGNVEAIRDFTDVRDVVRAYRLLLEHGQLGQVYHVASGRGVVVKELLNQLLELSRIPISVEKDSSLERPVDVPISIGDATKLRQATGWQPTIPWSQTVGEILDWWRKTYHQA